MPDQEPDIVQRLAPSLTPSIQAQLRSSSNGYELIAQAIKDGQVDPLDLVMRCLHELETEMTKNMQLLARVTEEPQGQTLDQLDQLRKEIRSVLARNYELNENPIPRLFVVLPLVHQPLYGAQESFSNTFRLYFLCDCGEHTMSATSKTPHHIHFSNHEGYDIIRPTEFFRRYGSYVLTIMRMIKFGICVAGITVPVLPHLVTTEAIGQATVDQQFLADTIEYGMDLVMEYIEKASTDKREHVVGIWKAGTSGSLQGSYLHELETFLKKKKEDKVLGNLYRIVTKEGHVKWVCIDHYREKFQKQPIESFQDTLESFGGSFNENIGRVEARLLSRDQAEQFNLALEKAKFVYELKLNLAWNRTHGDFKTLRDTLAKTNVGVLELDLNYEDGPASDTRNQSRRYDPIFDIMRHPSIKSVAIVQPPQDFIAQSNLLSGNINFPNLKHLEIDLWRLDSDILGLKNLVAKAPNLSGLILTNTAQNSLRDFNAISEYQTYPITFKDIPLRILPPTVKSQQSMTIENKIDLLKLLGGRIEVVKLLGNELDDSTIGAFARATENGSKLQELTVWRAKRRLGERCIQDLASVIGRSRLRKFDIHLENEEDRTHILESIQWEHIRDLTIRMEEGSLGMGPLKAIVDGTEKLSGRVEVERFELYYETPRRILSIAQEQLLRLFVASTPLKHLHLDVLMSLEQVLSLISSANTSQLQHLAMVCKDFKYTEVEVILDKLQHATELQTLYLFGATITTQQIWRMKRKPDFKDIICGQIDGENVVFWEDIEQVFPGVKYITNGNTVISMMRDSNRKRITPQCIKYYPGIVLGVVLSTTVNDNPLESSVGAPAVSRTEGVPISPTTTPDLDPEIVQRLVPSLAPGIQARLGPTSNGYELIAQAIKEGRLDPSDFVKRCFQELKTEMTKNTQLSTRTESPTPQSDQLSKQIQAVMARNYELYENPIPRL
ncbi:hypothetical protein BGX34_001677, partial [Mortierella sp. NVP85]